jgi:hypothetical protein
MRMPLLDSDSSSGAGDRNAGLEAVSIEADTQPRAGRELTFQTLSHQVGGSIHEHRREMLEEFAVARQREATGMSQ